MTEKAQIERAKEDFFEALDQIGFEAEGDDGDGNQVGPLTAKEWFAQVEGHLGSLARDYHDWMGDSWDTDLAPYEPQSSFL